MTLTDSELSELVETYDQLESYSIIPNPYQILFSLKGDYEILVEIKNENGDFVALGEYRRKGKRGFGEVNSIMTGRTEFAAVEAVISNLVDYDLKKRNR